MQVRPQCSTIMSLKKSLLDQIVKLRYDDMKTAKYDENYEKAERLHGCGELCPLCGKYLKNYDQLFDEGKIIHMFEGGEYITDQDWNDFKGHEDELNNDPAEMGWFPVGTDCYRRFKKAMAKAHKDMKK